MQQNCKDILERFKDGDSYAYEKLYNLYREDALRFCNYILKDKGESENIIHDVFLKIWIKRSYVNPSLNFKSYLLTIIKNQVADYYKEERKNRFTQEKFRELAAECIRINNEFKEEQIEKIKQEIGNLTERRREIIELNYKEGKSYKEIANQLNISSNTVKNLLAISKKTIRDKLIVV